MTPAPVSRMDRAYLDIRHRIITGACRPGTPLSESALARMVRPSRTPIREALGRLLEEGYVERVPGRGFQVARITAFLEGAPFGVHGPEQRREGVEAVQLKFLGMGDGRVKADLVERRLQEDGDEQKKGEMPEKRQP